MALTGTAAGFVAEALSSVPTTVLLLALMALVATGVFLRWFVALTPSRRRDVLSLVRTLRGK